MIKWRSVDFLLFAAGSSAARLRCERGAFRNSCTQLHMMLTILKAEWLCV